MTSLFEDLPGGGVEVLDVGPAEAEYELVRAVLQSGFQLPTIDVRADRFTSLFDGSVAFLQREAGPLVVDVEIEGRFVTGERFGPRVVDREIVLDDVVERLYPWTRADHFAR